MTDDAHLPPLIGVAGWKNSGKTTLVERLVTHFVARGWRVATIKHAHHAATVDDGATDSARHRRAGAAAVALVTPTQLAIVEPYDEGDEPTLRDVAARLGPADLILVEGYKTAAIPKLEIRRRTGRPGPALASNDPHVFAIVTDHEPDDASHPGLPVFALDDIAGIADLVARRMGRPL
jgi:molybdopterin-guanine dinucleotide biosynthesis protein B